MKLSYQVLFNWRLDWRFGDIWNLEGAVKIDLHERKLLIWEMQQIYRSPIIQNRLLRLLLGGEMHFKFSHMCPAGPPQKCQFM